MVLVGVALSTIFLNLKDLVPRWYSSFIFKEIKIEFDLALHETDGSQEEGWFYYDTGKGFNETESVKFKYSKKVDGQFQHYAVIFKPGKPVFRLRFDPLQGEGYITIKNIVVGCYLPKELNLSPSKHNWLAYKSIEKIIHTSKGIEIVTNGRDPHLLIVDNLSEYCQKDIFGFVQNISWFRIMAAIGVIALIFFIPLFSKPLSKLNLLLILPSILLLPAIYYSLDNFFYGLIRQPIMFARR